MPYLHCVDYPRIFYHNWLLNENEQNIQPLKNQYFYMVSLLYEEAGSTQFPDQMLNAFLPTNLIIQLQA